MQILTRGIQVDVELRALVSTERSSQNKQSLILLQCAFTISVFMAHWMLPYRTQFTCATVVTWSQHEFSPLGFRDEQWFDRYIMITSCLKLTVRGSNADYCTSFPSSQLVGPEAAHLIIYQDTGLRVNTVIMIYLTLCKTNAIFPGIYVTRDIKTH